MSETFVNLLKLRLREQYKHARPFEINVLLLVHERDAKKPVAMLIEFIGNFIHTPTEPFHHVKTEENCNVYVNDICVLEQKVSSIVDRHANFCLTQASVNLFSHAKSL